jgi:hypothetical protein
MRPQFQSSTRLFGFPTEFWITRLGRLPSVGSYSPALTDMEVGFILCGAAKIFYQPRSNCVWTGFVHRFLSWKLFIPLSRLSYSVYLTHLIYTFAYISHLRKPYYFTEISGAMNFAGILVISFLLAFVVSVAVEMPFVNLDKLLFAGDSKSLQSKQNCLFNYLQLKRGNFFFRRKEKNIRAHGLQP